MSDELQIEDIRAGQGPAARPGQQLVVHYTGWLADGTRFDSSHERGKPLRFRLGAAEVILGWDDGLVGMQVGGLRRLTVPPKLAYGRRGRPGVIPRSATLRFEVELLALEA